MLVLSNTSKEGILTLTINRPKQYNAVNDETYNEMTRALQAAASDEAVSVVVVTGAGDKAFCAGADLDAGFDSSVGPLKSKRGSYYDPVGRFMSAVIAFPKPLVAAVNGVAVGVGTTILLHCDAVYAVPSATFFTPFAQVGACPEFCSSLLLPRVVGTTLATEMMFFGRRLTAAEAKANRLVGEVLPAENFLEQVYQRIRPTLAFPNAAKSMRLFKGMMRSPASVAELERVHVAEMAMLDFRSVGKDADTAVGVAAMRAASAAKSKASSPPPATQQGGSKL